MEKTTLLFVFLIGILTTAVSLSAQNERVYTVKISGASQLKIDKEVDYDHIYFNLDHPFAYDPIYPDASGVFFLELPAGSYEYVAYKKGMKTIHGSFYLFDRNLCFKILMRPLYSGESSEDVCSSFKMFHDGNASIIDEEYDKARDFFRQGAESGEVSCMYNYAFMLKNGVGGKRDRKQAYFWLVQAYEHGHYNAEKRLVEFNKKWKWGYTSCLGKSWKDIH